MPTDGSDKERIEYCVRNLKDVKSPYAERASLMKQMKKFFEEEEKVSDEDVSFALKQFRKPFITQVSQKYNYDIFAVFLFFAKNAFFAAAFVF